MKFPCRSSLVLSSLLALSPAGSIFAADEPVKKEDKPAADVPKDPVKPRGRDDEKLVETRHKLTINGQEISYTARAGTIALRDAEDKPTAQMFYIAYTRDGYQ